MSSYYEHQARKGKRDEVALDVIEPDFPVTPGVEVRELKFDDTATFMAYVARETGRGP